MAAEALSVISEFDIFVQKTFPDVSAGDDRNNIQAYSISGPE